MAVVLNRRCATPTGGSIISRGCEPSAPYNMGSFIIEFTNKRIRFYILFYVRGGLETKDNYLREAWYKGG